MPGFPEAEGEKDMSEFKDFDFGATFDADAAGGKLDWDANADFGGFGGETPGAVKTADNEDIANSDFTYYTESLEVVGTLAKSANYLKHEYHPKVLEDTYNELLKKYMDQVGAEAKDLENLSIPRFSIKDGEFRSSTSATRSTIKVGGVPNPTRVYSLFVAIAGGDPESAEAKNMLDKFVQENNNTYQIVVEANTSNFLVIRDKSINEKELVSVNNNKIVTSTGARVSGDGKTIVVRPKNLVKQMILDCAVVSNKQPFIPVVGKRNGEEVKFAEMRPELGRMSEKVNAHKINPRACFFVREPLAARANVNRGEAPAIGTRYTSLISCAYDVGVVFPYAPTHNRTEDTRPSGAELLPGQEEKLEKFRLATGVDLPTEKVTLKYSYANMDAEIAKQIKASQGVEYDEYAAQLQEMGIDEALWKDLKKGGNRAARISDMSKSQKNYSEWYAFINTAEGSEQLKAWTR